MFQVLHSSAGAGKTHALVKHYLGLSLKGDDPGAYRQVLALTFTNKAAGEMKERVIEYLEKLALGDVEKVKYADVMEHLVRITGSNHKTVSERAAKIISHMLHNWSDVSISTIDSFTRRVVQPFARDLRLDHELRMTTEHEHYRNRAVETLIDEAGVDPSITGLLTEVCLQLLDDERRWDPEKPLRELSRELDKESSIKPLQELSGLDSDRVIALTHELRAQEKEFRDKVRSIGNKALGLIREASIDEVDVAYGKNGVLSFYRKLAQFEESLEAPGSNVTKTLDSGKWHSGKADASVIAALQHLAPQLEGLILDAVDLRETEFKAFTIRRAVRKELLTAYTLHALDERLEQIKRDDGVAFFSDLTRKVAEVVKNEPVPFIHERMGERYRHYLIDEFQDTSLLQWNALLPLVDEALGKGGSALLVGDAKQAIYRWRNGEVRLFTQFPALFGRDPEDDVEAEREANLERNYKEAPALTGNHRSASTIVSFNNDLFEVLAPSLSEDLQSVYLGHAQDVVRKSPGLVDLRILDSALRGEELRDAMLDGVMQSVNEAVEDGFAHGDIAILTRSKKVGSEVASHLVAHGKQVISPDGLRLSNDPLIQLLINFLQFMHTSDAAAATRVLQYQAMLASPDDATEVDPFAGMDAKPDPVALLRRWMRANGNPRLQTTVGDLVVHLARSHGYRPGSDVQLSTLLDEVHSWTLENGQDIGGFLEHWERTGGQRSVVPPKHGEAIQVMTVHRAKGLQFPVVIIPDASMASTRNHGDHFWIAPGDAVPELPFALVTEGAAIKTAELPELIEEDQLRTLDAVNLTYVAFTRPEQRLYAFIHGNKKDLITEGVKSFMALAGDPDRYCIGERTAPWELPQSSDLQLMKDVSDADALASLAMRFEAPDNWDPSDPDPYRAYGTAVHAVLENIRTAEDLPAAMAEALDTGLLTQEAADELGPQLASLLHSPALQPWFAAGVEVRTEATLITPEGHAIRPDRIVIEGNTARVLDIKTGKAHQSHHDQVKDYMARLREVGFTEVEGALLYVRSGTIEQVSA